MFSVMARVQTHQFIILTKRAERMRDFCRKLAFVAPDELPHLKEPACSLWCGERPISNPRPLPNVWLGITVVNQVEADRDIPILLQTPAAVRFLSVEPMLEAIDLWQVPDWGIFGGESGPG